MVIIVALVAIFPQYMTQTVDETGEFGNLDGAHKIQPYNTPKVELQAVGDGYNDTIIEEEETPKSNKQWK